MDRPIVLTGVITGKTITLDEDPGLSEGHRVTLHLILKPEEALELAFGGWADMTAEEIGIFQSTPTGRTLAE